MVGPRFVGGIYDHIAYVSLCYAFFGVVRLFTLLDLVACISDPYFTQDVL